MQGKSEICAQKRTMAFPKWKDQSKHCKKGCARLFRIGKCTLKKESTHLIREMLAKNLTE